MHHVTSTNVRAVGYDSSTRTMRVAFLNGRVYDYYDVGQALFEQMLLPHPWRRLGFAVRRHRYRRVVAA
ncbi:KTSC domain-containing protein [Kribbella pratensis]